MGLSASYSDASSSGIQNSGNNAVISHGRNGANLPAFPFGDKSSDIELNNPLFLLGGATALFVILAVLLKGSRP